MEVTRFAPSPTGPLHLGHAYAALVADRIARDTGGRFLLRIEDIDQSRCRPNWETRLKDDLHWLGLDWPEPVLRQSERLAEYARTLRALWDRGLLYACQCNRRDIAAAASAPQEGAAPILGPDGLVYPGTCRAHPQPPAPPANGALRLDMRRAMAATGPTLRFTEIDPDLPVNRRQVTLTAEHMIHGIGDIVLARRDMGTSYHLSVVLDDAAQSITRVTRGQDLFDATAIHVLLQRLLDLPTPDYSHHRLIRDEQGKRLAKRDDARALATYREQGVTPAGIRTLLGLA